MRKYGTWVRILLGCLLLVASMFAFYRFSVKNRQRILSQNENYLADVTIQTANRLGDQLQARRRSINLLALTVAETIDEPWVSQELLTVLQGASIFDYVEFIDANGVNHNADGVQSDSSDRPNYLEGIQGKTGVNVVYNSRITHETIIIFYTPLFFDGEVFGVLCGMFREATLRQAISTQLFDTTANTYLCNKDGTLISSYGASPPPDNVLEDLKTSGKVSEEVFSQIEEAFRASEPLNYTYQGSSGMGNGSLTPVYGSTDWMLLQTFPSSLTKKMVENANVAGVNLELTLLGLSAIYIVALILLNLRGRRRLETEKMYLSQVIEGLVPLFTRLVIIDYHDNTYEYVEGTERGVPPHGPLEDLATFVTNRYIPVEGYADPTDLLRSQEAAAECLKDDRPYYQYEYQIQWEEPRWENASLLCLRRENGVPVSLLFAVQDVTELKEQDVRIHRTMQEAFHAAEDANRAKSDFLARMSHDMRTPMNGILGMTAIALMHLDDRDRVRDCLEKIDSSSQHLLSLINEVLDMSKIESGKVMLSEEEFQLSAAVDQAVALIRSHAAEKGQTLTVSPLDFSHDCVLGDPLRLQQVLVNLLSNAVKYTGEGGAISLEARELPASTAEVGAYEFVVTDNGIGMEPSFLPHIFEPFSRSETSQVRNVEGTGLGMPIARTLVQLMNGDIQVESKLGEGSKFTVHVYLKLWTGKTRAPSGGAPAVRPAPVSAVPAKPERRYEGVRILLAEDNELNREIAVELLSMTGAQVDTAHDGQEAVDMARAHPPGWYSLIFMDIQMPRKDGYQATRELRATEDRPDLRDIPIVAMSANAFQEDVQRSRKAGMNGHLAKPVALDKLMEALNQWLQRNPEN